MSFLFRFLGYCTLLVPLLCNAGVVVTQNVAPGATSWPGIPIIQSVTNPAAQVSVGESFNAVGGCTNYCQTFTITTSNYILQTISIYAGGGTGTGVNTNLTLRLFDLGTQTAPNPSPYAGTDLFGSGNGLSITYTPQTTGVLQFDFTGGDQVTLTNGRMYAFEINGALNSSPVVWQRTTNDTYSGGAAYRNRSWINGNNAREFALAVYGNAFSNSPPSTNPPVFGSSVVNWNDVRQRIDGFGGSVQFLNPGSLDPVPNSVMNTLFNRTNANQLGLSILRIGIDPVNWNNNQLLDAQKAVARGASILASPWTPPASMKDNNDRVGGSLLPAQYTNYAIYLNNFARFMGSNNAPVKVVSIQNEPDITVTYDSCDWTASQLRTFCRDVGGLITNTALMMPESFNFNFSKSDPTLNDTSAVTNVDYIGGHLYGVNTIVNYANAHSKGKPVWMTEYLINDQTIETAIQTAKQIHDCLTVANMSAYIWWKTYGDANGLVNASGVPQKRGFVFAQWSWFVRPNDYRIGVVNTGKGVVSAYKGTNSGQFAIVAINTNASASLIQTFSLTNFTAASVTPWITSASQSLAVQSALTVSNGTFEYTLPPLSVVTFVGQQFTNPPNASPVFAPVNGLTVNPGVMLMITNLVTDPGVPPEALTFALLDAPTNASLVPLNATNVLFTWRPLISQADKTNTIQVKVTDNGTPNLSATNSFVITVNAASQPTLTSILVGSGQVSLSATGMIGPDYTLLTSTNLLNWQSLSTTNPTTMPVGFTDTNQTDDARFYRLQLGE